MKKRFALLSIMLFVLILSACGASSEESSKISQTTYEKIQKRLIALDSYKSEATVTYKSNKGSNTYDTLHQCKMDGKYRIEVTAPKNVAGNITLSDGKLISQFNPKIEGKVSIGVKENPERSEIFLTSFVKNYLASQEVSVSVGNFGEGKCTILEAKVPGNHPYLATEKLWVDNKTLNPVKLIVYDPDSSERIIVNFKTFEYNVVLDDSVFAAPY